MSLSAVVEYEVAEISLGPANAEQTSASVDVTFTDPEERNRHVPAFIAGGVWRVRYSSGLVGTHRYRGRVSGGSTLSNPRGSVEIVHDRKRQGALQSHGPLQVARDQRHLEHADGTPFLWLADTWWHGFTARLSDEEFRELAAKRVEQGFSVVQIVAGLYPEMVPFAPEGRSSTGWVWCENFTSPNLAWFDEADRRVIELVDHDLVPCIFGSWAYYLQFMNVTQIVRHWREMIARWGAYPVVWCLAGEPPLALSEDLLQHVRATQCDPTSPSMSQEQFTETLHDESAISGQLKRLNEVARRVRQLEPFGRPITVHSGSEIPPWEHFDDENHVDFWLLQTGHWGQHSLQPSVNAVHDAVAHVPIKPVINGEVCYEGICGSSWQEIQRFLFWSHILSGTAGHSYGAQGVWGFNTPDYPCGIMGRWGELMWPEAAALPGAAHLGTGRKLLLGLPWNQFEPHPEWIEPHQQVDDRLLPYAAGARDGPRIIYFPALSLIRAGPQRVGSPRLHELGTRRWQARYINPRTGNEEPPFVVAPDTDGTAVLRGKFLLFALPSAEDWLLVLVPGE